TVLDFTMIQLQNSVSEAEQHSRGSGMDYVTRPWALLLVRDTTQIQKALEERANSLQRSETARKQRKWLEDIRIW
ncbi:hypothetical protein DFQ29_007153, partial [Apophysomyces sp. BC1021]